MADRPFEFELYRMNLIEKEPTIFHQELRGIRADNDILRVLEQATKPDYLAATQGPRATYKWALRAFCDYGMAPPVVSITLARSTVERQGFIVTDNGIEEGLSEAEPPLAEAIQLFFHMGRHLVAVEHLSTITDTNRWREVFEGLFEKAALDLGYWGTIDLEPVPREEEILKAFRSFERLSRLRLVLRLPNPELTRYSKKLYDEMLAGGIREYLQDMKNPRGLSQEPGQLPHASVEIAQAGYKRGTVKMEGVRNGKKEKVETGLKAARGRLDILRDFVRSIREAAGSAGARQVVESLVNEIDRISSPPGEGRP